MFLVDSALAASDWDGVLATIKNILAKAQAEIVSLKKWSDRRLAYEINHKNKGVYVLCYFKADGGRIREIERSIRLTESIMRALILNAEDQTVVDDSKAAVSVAQAENNTEEAVQNIEQQQENAGGDMGQTD